MQKSAYVVMDRISEAFFAPLEIYITLTPSDRFDHIFNTVCFLQRNLKKIKCIAVDYTYQKNMVTEIQLGILYEADLDPDPDLQKKRTLYQNSLYEYQVRGC